MAIPTAVGFGRRTTGATVAPMRPALRRSREGSGTQRPRRAPAAERHPRTSGRARASGDYGAAHGPAGCGRPLPSRGPGGAGRDRFRACSGTSGRSAGSPAPAGHWPASRSIAAATAAFVGRPRLERVGRRQRPRPASASHVAQHVLLGIVAPLCIVLAAPLTPGAADVDPARHAVVRRWSTVRPVQVLAHPRRRRRHLHGDRRGDVLHAAVRVVAATPPVHAARPRPPGRDRAALLLAAGRARPGARTRAAPGARSAC